MAIERWRAVVMTSDGIDRTFRRLAFNTDQDALVLDRLASGGLALLAEHDISRNYEHRSAMGRVVDFSGNGKTVEATIEIDPEADPRAADLSRDWQAGRNVGVSLGLRMVEVDEEPIEDEAGSSEGKMLLYVSKWEPLELSVVGVKAVVRAQVIRRLD